MTALDQPDAPRCPKCSSEALEALPHGSHRRWLCLGCNTATDGSFAEHDAERKHRATQADQDAAYRAARDRHHQETP